MMQCHETPLVSIGIPTYQRPAELAETLQQILNQSYNNIEIIVSDNGSEDGTVASIVAAAQLSDHRVRFYRQQWNVGPLQNFQFVLDQAKGKYFMWCADDDWHAPEFVASLVALHEADPQMVLAFCNFSAIDSYGNVVSRYGDFLPRLRRFSTTSGWLRQWEFFIQDESKGKANIIYGLYRRQQLSSFNWARFAKRHGTEAVDNLFIFWILGLGNFGLVESTLYASRVDNKKLYLAPRLRFDGPRRLLRWTYYLGQYARMAPWPLVPVYVAGAIFKLVSFIGARLLTRMVTTPVPSSAGEHTSRNGRN